MRAWCSPRSFHMFMFVTCVLVLAMMRVGAAGVSGQGTPVASACLATPVASQAPAFPLAIVDDAGRQVEIPEAPERIISIAPSNTEMLYALGLEDRLVAVDSYSTYPAAAADKPEVGSYLEPDLELVVSADPDLVLVSEAHVGTVLPELENLDLPTIVLEPTSLDEVFSDIELVGAIAGEPARAQQLVCTLQERVDMVTTTVADAPRPTVFFELSPDLYSAGPGSYVDDLIDRAGGENIAASAAQMWPQMSTEAVVSADPEVIILADHEAGVTPETVAARPGWEGVSAVEQDRVVTIESDLVARPGPRVVDGLEAIAAALHPDLFPESGA